jgi:chromosome segregation ATPase
MRSKKHESELQATIDSATSELKEKVKELEAAVADSDTLAQTNRNQSAQLAQFNATLTKAQATIAEKDKAVATSQRELAAKETALKEAATRLNATKAEAAHLETESKDINVTLAKTTADEKSLDAQLTSEHKQTATL